MQTHRRTQLDKPKRREKKKHFVIDTSALLHSPNVINSFQDNYVYIPFVVLEELDRFKKKNDETGRNSRATARYLDELRKKGCLTKGVKINKSGKVMVLNNYIPPASNLDMTINDNIILSTAHYVRTESAPLKDVVVVTNDINLRIKADSMGLEAEPFGKRKIKNTSRYRGIKEITISHADFNLYKRNGWVGMEKDFIFKNTLHPNEYLIINSDNGKRALGRYDQKKGRIVRLIGQRSDVFGIRSRSEEQQFAIDALLDDDVKLVSLSGKAGTGKTLLAVAAGLEKIVNDNVYTKLLISRPVEPMGKDIGFLPGDMNEKLAPWMQPIKDNLDFLFDLQKKHAYKSKRKPRKDKKGSQNRELPSQPSGSYDKLTEDGTIQVEALTYIRGRSIPEQFMIIDEAQNLTPHEVKTIVTRAGEGTKIIFTGDTQQIDSPYLDESSNGLSYCFERLKNLSISAHITLEQGERSELAEAGSKYL